LWKKAFDYVKESQRIGLIIFFFFN
jgi:hypothetical protein